MCRLYRGRGAFETLGTGMDMRSGDIAFKVLSLSLKDISGYIFENILLFGLVKSATLRG